MRRTPLLEPQRQCVHAEIKTHPTALGFRNTTSRSHSSHACVEVRVQDPNVIVTALNRGKRSSRRKYSV